MLDEHLLQEERDEGHADDHKVQEVEGVSAEGTLMKESSIHSHLSNTPTLIFINVHTQNKAKASTPCSNTSDDFAHDQSHVTVQNLIFKVIFYLVFVLLKVLIF